MSNKNLYTGLHANGRQFWIQHADDNFLQGPRPKGDKRKTYQQWLNSEDHDGETFAVKQARLTELKADRKKRKQENK